MIYLDNAATSWPKPPCMAEAMMRFLNEIGSNPGRSAHRLSIESGRIVYAAREAISQLFNISDPLRVVFGLNVTEALNLALHGLLSPGDHVITGSMEHNSVMRPLRTLERQGVEVTVVPCTKEGYIDPADVAEKIRGNTVLIVLNHASNVVGSLQPVAEIGAIARRARLIFLVDAAQTGGSCVIDMESSCIDLLAFTGHKSLLGPMGTGGLIIGERVDVKRIRPLKQGGTGSRSEHEEQPDFLPDVFESGTPNVVGLAGLNVSVRWIMEQGVDTIRAHEKNLTQRMIDGLCSIPDVVVYGSKTADLRVGIVSFNAAGIEPSEVGMRLDEEHDIMCRVGLHCSPAAHRTIGTFPSGAVRFGLSIFNKEAEIDAAVEAVASLKRNI